jgi:hypothetical protein
MHDRVRLKLRERDPHVWTADVGLEEFLGGDVAWRHDVDPQDECARRLAPHMFDKFAAVVAGTASDRDALHGCCRR